MALKLKFDKIEDIEENLRPMYAERDGAFYLDVDGIDEHPLVSKAKSNLEAARRSERAMKQQVEKWEKLGKSDEEIAALIAEQEQNKHRELEAKGQWEELKKQMNERHQLDIKKWEGLTQAEKDNNLKLRGKLERYLIDAKATAAIAAAEGEPELLLPIVKRFMKVTEDENGEFYTSIVDDKGGARVNGKGDPLTIEELLVEMKSSEKLGRAFKASGSSGGGSSPGGGSNPKLPPAGVPKTWAEAKTPEDKAKFIAHQKTLKASA